MQTGNDAIRIKPRSFLALQPGDIIIKEHWGQRGFANTHLDFPPKKQKNITVMVIGLHGPSFAHKILETAELLAALPRE